MQRKDNPETLAPVKVEEEKYAPRTFAKWSSEDLGREAEGEVILMNCNEAIARGAIEAGVRIAASYPGSPVQYVLDSLVAAKALYPSMHIEWSVNEKTAFEVAMSASWAGVRGLACFKNVGLNWIVDTLLNAAARGFKGVVTVFNDDPMAESTGDLQDGRYLLRYGLCPVLDPSTMQEVKDFVVTAFDLSEEQRVPVFVRVMERIGYGREPVVLGKIQHQVRERKAECDPKDVLGQGKGFGKPQPKGKVLPRVAQYHTYYGPYKRMYGEAPEETVREVGERPNLKAIGEAIDSFAHHRLILKEGAKVGVITVNTPYQLVLEAIDVLGAGEEVSILKSATSYPLPIPMVKKILEETDTVLVVEEIESFVEDQVAAIAGRMDKHAKILGKVTKHIPYTGELERDQIGLALAEILGKEYKPRASLERVEKGKNILFEELKFGAELQMAKNCPGCPEYNGLYALKVAARDVGIETFGVYDDGCHNLTVEPPLSIENAFMIMGGAIGGAHGLSKTGITDKKIVAFEGDSTFFHAGISELANAVYNKGNILVCILDNRATAMTGHQPHPGGFGITATGEPTKLLDIVEICKALQVDFIGVVDPYDQKQSRDVFEQAIRTRGVSVVVVRRTCAIIALRQRGVGVRALGVRSKVDQERCLSWIVETAPCQAACPAGVDVEGYNVAIAEGDFKKAIEIIREKIPFPATVGRICHHPCEQNCKRGKVDDPIAIGALKRFAADYERKEGIERPTPAERTKEEKVAIIGSGPAGLTAAYDLVRKGYGVTVYEALPVAGGMLTAGIPEFKLSPEIVDDEINYIKDVGVDIKTNTSLGKDITLDDLSKEGYKAIFLAIGAQRGLTLPLPGSDLEGIVSALPFLREIKLGKEIKLPGRVVVIGGGDVAIDVARTAFRLGAEQVDLACLESRPDMPALVWEIKKAEEEGVSIHPGMAPQRFRGSNGKVATVEFKRVVASTSIDSEGRLSWTLMEGPGSDMVLDADAVIVAIGQAVDLSTLGDGRFAASRRGTFEVDDDTLATNVPGIFAGGDAVSGPASMVEAIAAGHRAAESIDRYLRGVDLKEGRVMEREPITGVDVLPSNIRPKERQVMPMVPPARRVSDFKEVELGFAEEMAIKEASRCLKCKACNLCIEDFGCVSLMWAENEALVKMCPQIELDTCVACKVCNQVCPYENIVEVEEMS